MGLTGLYVTVVYGLDCLAWPETGVAEAGARRIRKTLHVVVKALLTTTKCNAGSLELSGRF